MDGAAGEIMNTPNREDESIPWHQTDASHIRALADRIWELSKELAVANERMKIMAASITELEADVKALTISAHRWKGGIAVVVAIGSLVGILINVVLKAWAGFK